MRVALVGNQGNNAYRICKWLREDGVDATLYLLDGESPQRSFPWLVDRDIETNRPPWIRELHGNPRQGRVQWRELRRARPTPETIAVEADHDVILTAGFHGLFLAPAFRRRPVVHLSLGSEVTDLPRRLFGRNEPARTRREAWLARRGLDHARAVLTSYSRTVETLVGLGHAAKTRPWGHPEDLDSNRSRIDRDLLARLDQEYGRYDAVFLWFSRLNFEDPRRADYKGPERFLAAFERIVREGEHEVRAIIGEHGRDAAAFRERVRSAGLESHVDFVAHLPYWKLLTHLAIERGILFDLIDVEKGTPGGVVREALSVGAPLAMALDHDSLEVFYGPDCPFFDVPTATACYQVMRTWLEMDTAERRAYAGRCAAWSRQTLDRRAACRRLLSILGEVRYCAEIDRKFQTWDSRDLAAEARVEC